MTTQAIVSSIMANLGESWKGKLPAKRQRELFGCFLGKGTIVVDLAKGRVEHVAKVCFGMDWTATSGIDIHVSGLSHKTWGEVK